MLQLQNLSVELICYVTYYLLYVYFFLLVYKITLRYTWTSQMFQFLARTLTKLGKPSLNVFHFSGRCLQIHEKLAQ